MAPGGLCCIPPIPPAAMALELSMPSLCRRSDRRRRESARLGREGWRRCDMLLLPPPVSVDLLVLAVVILLLLEESPPLVAPLLGCRIFFGLKIMASPSMVRRVCSSGRGMCLALVSSSGGGGGTLGCLGLVPSGDGPNESCRRSAPGGGPEVLALPAVAVAAAEGDEGCDAEDRGGSPPPGLAEAEAAADAGGPRSRPLRPPAMAAISARASAAALAHADDFPPRGLPCGVVTGDCEAEVLLPETAPIPGDGGWAACGMCRGDAGGVFAGDRDRDRGGRPGIELN